MPLKAKINGRPVISVDIPEEEWKQLQERLRQDRGAVELYCCDSPVFLRTSKLGTNHFVHRLKKPCGWEPETYEHLKAKELIFKICRLEGWVAEPEYILDDCIADVFASDGNRHVAFEIQLSRQSAEITIERHKKYIRRGMKCIWLFRNIPRSLVSDTYLPVFELRREDTVFTVRIDSTPIKLTDAVVKFLRGEIRYRKKYTFRKHQSADLYSFDMVCWQCKKPTPVVAVYSYYRYRCGVSPCRMSLDDDDIGREVARLQKEGMEELKVVGPIEKRRSKATGKEYWSNCCRWCGALIGRRYLQGAFIDQYRYEPEPLMKAPFVLQSKREADTGSPHWCLGCDEGYCEHS